MKRLTLCLLVLAACNKSTPAREPSPQELTPATATATAPATFKARFTTTKGDFVVQVTRDWAPKGADRFYNLVKMGYYTNIGFFRVISGFMGQFGIHGNPEVNKLWRAATIEDDPSTGHSNKRGTLTFAKGGPNTRTVQLFINFVDNPRLDAMGFPPIGEIVEGMDVVDQLYKVGEGKPAGPGPAQNQVQMEGNAYLKRDYPQLDYIKSAKIE